MHSVFLFIRRHFGEYELAITDLNLFLEKLHTGDFDETLFVTHASRSDIVTGYVVIVIFKEYFKSSIKKSWILNRTV